jgi:hypothetical protein
MRPDELEQHSANAWTRSVPLPAPNCSTYFDRVGAIESYWGTRPPAPSASS